MGEAGFQNLMAVFNVRVFVQLWLQFVPPKIYGSRSSRNKTPCLGPLRCGTIQNVTHAIKFSCFYRKKKF